MTHLGPNLATLVPPMVYVLPVVINSKYIVDHDAALYSGFKAVKNLK